MGGSNVMAQNYGRGTPKNWTLYIDELHPTAGPVFNHFVLLAKLGSKKIVIDPAARRWGYKGPYGSLIVIKEEEDYKNGFPGKVLSITESSERPELMTLIAYYAQGP